MKRNIKFAIITFLLCCSLVVNILLVYKIGMNNHIKTYISNTSPTDEGKQEDVFKNNPINNFFDTHELIGSDTSSMSDCAFLKRRLWKAEMDNAYNVLISHAHKDIKDSLKKDQTKINEYAEIEANIFCAINGSDAFGDEGGQIPEKIAYGTICGVLWNTTIAEIFENKTKELFEYCKILGIDIRFIFNENTISKDDLSLFKTKK